MKKSKFIIDYYSINDKYYMLHTESGNIIATDVGKKNRLTSILENPEKYIQEKAFNKLCEYGFLISDEKDEQQIINAKKILRNYTDNNYLEITVMPTEACNFRCVYCYENFEKSKMLTNIQKAIILYVKRQLTNHKGLIISWFGGEPLLAMDVIYSLSTELIKICKLYKNPFKASITTNGYLLTLDTFEILRKLHVNHFQITIDGDRKNHNDQRLFTDGSGTYDTIMKNLYDIRDHAQGNLWTVSLRTNVTNEIIHNRINFINDVIIPFNNDKRFYIMLRKMWTNNSIIADSLLCTDKDFELFVQSCNISANSLMQEYRFSYNLNFMCYASNPNSLVIGSDGLLYKCTYALYEDINQIGKIKSDGALNINLEKLSFWIAPRVGNDGVCYDCPNYATCVSSGCPFKQKQYCNGETLEVLKYLIPQFYYLAEKSFDITSLL